jgi:hypothetical protein
LEKLVDECNSLPKNARAMHVQKNGGTLFWNYIIIESGLHIRQRYRPDLFFYKPFNSPKKSR